MKVEVEVRDAAEIDEIFDIISYSKGCSIIRMLASFLGNDVFKKALNSYLNKHKYGNAITEVHCHLVTEGLSVAGNLNLCRPGFVGCFSRDVRQASEGTNGPLDEAGKFQ